MSLLRLPAELLHEIFLTASDDWDLFKISITGFKSHPRRLRVTTARISMVSTPLKSLIHHSSRMYLTSVAITFDHRHVPTYRNRLFSQVKEVLEKSENSDVNIDLRYDGPMPDCPGWSIVEPYMSQCRSLNVGFVTGGCSAITEKTFSCKNLERLRYFTIDAGTCNMPL